MDDRVSMVRALDNLLQFYAHESCGQCTPCREGTTWLRKIMKRIVDGKAHESDVEKMLTIGDNMVGNTICVLADAAVFPLRSFVAKFKDEFLEYIRGGKRLSLLDFHEEAEPAYAEAH